MSAPPVLLLVFNRPGLTRRVLEAVRPARPPRLYVAADGPRPGRGEEALCREAREAATAVDWPCEVRILFREGNLGCARAVSGAIDWFFSQEEEGIILEDDCLPAPSFFPYCAELLERYRDQERVMTVSGSDFRFGRPQGPFSYGFSIYPLVTGWATWRRAWARFDLSLSAWPRARDGGFLSTLLGPAPARHFTSKLEQTRERVVDSWGYPWAFACWMNGGLAAIPGANLISNLGFGDVSTHTRGGSHLSAMALGEVSFPLRHPSAVVTDPALDRRIFSCRYDDRPWPRWRNRWWRARRWLREGGRL